VLSAQAWLPKNISLKVWNTIGCNACPEEKWQNVEWSNTLISNGPRIWQMDSIVQEVPQANAVDQDGFYLVGAWNGIGSMLVANMEFKLDSWEAIQEVIQRITSHSAYVLTYVARQTVWRYRPGRQVHQLVDDKGNVYTMQASEVSSTESIMGLTYAPAIPTGWTYRCRVLGPSGLDVAANATGIATILQDEFRTVYMLTEAPECDSLYADDSCKTEDWTSVANQCKEASAAASDFAEVGIPIVDHTQSSELRITDATGRTLVAIV